MAFRSAPRASLVAVASLVVAACGESGTPAGDAAGNALSTADLGGIVDSGRLRVLVEREPDSYLPRHGAGLYAERELAARFAERHGIDAELVFVDRFADLLPALLAGRGDVAAANLTVTPEREDRVRFTRPIDFSRDRLVTAAGRTPPVDDAGLSGRLAAREETTLLETARRLAAGNPALEVVAVDSTLSNEALLDRVAAGEFDYAVQDGNVLRQVLEYRDDVAAGRPLTGPRPLAWAVRPGNPRLLAALNEFLAEYRLLGESEERYVADLAGLKDRRRLRMITRNNAATYFLWRGELLGFEYELGKRFAESQGLQLEVVVAPSHDDMIPMLLAGEGDFIAAYLVPSEERKAQDVAFTRPYHYASEVLVGPADGAPIESPLDLAGREIAVRRTSSYRATLEAVEADHGIDIDILDAPADLETQEIVAAVAEGRYPLTVADSHILDIEMTWRDDIRALGNLGDEQPHAWALHPQNEALKAAMDDFLERTYRGLFYNVSYAKYFESPRHVRDEAAELVAPGRVSPWDDLVRTYADRYGFDWRLIVAQMHQESRFDPEAQSWMGAQGLMQVLPRTGREFGFENLTDPETGIHAGVRYLDWVRERFSASLAAGERTWFALAGYNAGHGHVRDARRLARELGLDPDRWFGNVEQAMLKLAEPEYARRARHGYVRGSEPVKYVRRIRQRYRAYTRLLAQASVSDVAH